MRKRRIAKSLLDTCEHLILSFINDEDILENFHSQYSIEHNEKMLTKRKQLSISQNELRVAFSSLIEKNLVKRIELDGRGQGRQLRITEKGRIHLLSDEPNLTDKLIDIEIEMENINKSLLTIKNIIATCK